MGDAYPVVKVAAVQAACVFLDREGSTEKACRLIHEAGGKGARVIGFPEGFIPAHPLWYHHHPATSQLANELAVALFKNAVEIPGPEIDALCGAAREANAYVVIGVCEKLPRTIGTMFNTQVYIGADGVLIGKHQKLVPTLGERLVHMGGFGDTFGAFQSEFGPMSGLICGTVDEPMIRRLKLDPEQEKLLRDSDSCGGSVIVAPSSRVIAGPMGAEEGILYAECRLELGVLTKLRHDFAGHYNRPDVFQLQINRSAPRLYSVYAPREAASLEPPPQDALPATPRALPHEEDR